jgi:dienelactone hydrolase
MAEILFFHHAQGLTVGVRAIAATLTGAGHTVHLPDLYDGETFPTVETGVAHARTLGFEAIIQRGTAIAEALSPGLVYAGISLGVLCAQKLAETRPGAKGALLLEACVPVTEFAPAWPAGVPVQIHGMDNDPSFALEGDLDAARALVASAPDEAELFLYPGESHLFTDSSLAGHDANAAALVMQRVLNFLDRIG